MRMLRTGICMLAVTPLLAGCVVAQVTGAAINTTSAVVGTTARTTGRVVGAAIPDGDDDGGSRDSGSYADGSAGGSSSGGYTRADAERDAAGGR